MSPQRRIGPEELPANVNDGSNRAIGRRPGKTPGWPDPLCYSDPRMTVAELLDASRRAHEQYRKNIPHLRANAKTGTLDTINGDAIASLQHLREARQLRSEAHALDPDHADPAWAAEVLQQYRHADLMNWYNRVLSQIDGVPLHLISTTDTAHGQA